MTKVLGERDITRNEALHQLMGLDLHTSNITVVKTTLESSKGINKNKRTNQLEFTDSFVDMYSNRFNSVKYQTTFEENDYNFMEFVRFFDSKRQNGELKLRSNPQINSNFSKVQFK